MHCVPYTWCTEIGAGGTLLCVTDLTSPQRLQRFWILTASPNPISAHQILNVPMDLHSCLSLQEAEGLTCKVLMRFPLRYKGKLTKLLYFVTTSRRDKKNSDDYRKLLEMKALEAAAGVTQQGKEDSSVPCPCHR